jgi:hypothetical protein
MIFLFISSSVEPSTSGARFERVDAPFDLVRERRFF